MTDVTVAMQDIAIHFRDVFVPRSSADGEGRAEWAAMALAKAMAMPRPLDEPAGRTWLQVEHEVDTRHGGKDPVVRFADGYTVKVGVRTWVTWTDVVAVPERTPGRTVYDVAHDVALGRAEPPVWADVTEGWTLHDTGWSLHWSDLGGAAAKPRAPDEPAESDEPEAFPLAGP